MKRIFLSLVFVIVCITGFAQIIQTKELEKYAKENYGDNWVEAATTLGSQITLDKNDAITYVEIINAEGKTKNDLYVILNYWFTSSFNDANSVIQLNDKELGTIIAQGYVYNVAEHTGGISHYVVSIRPVIKCDIKDNKVRISYTIPFYSVTRIVGGGALSMLSGTTSSARAFDLNWLINECFPFVKKDKHKKTSCKSLVMAHAYSNVIMDKIKEVIQNGLIGNETEDW